MVAYIAGPERVCLIDPWFDPVEIRTGGRVIVRIPNAEERSIIADSAAEYLDEWGFPAPPAAAGWLLRVRQGQSMQHLLGRVGWAIPSLPFDSETERQAAIRAVAALVAEHCD